MRNKRIAALAALLLLAVSPARADFRAERITPGNAEELLFGGSDADGGVGDWYLSNGVVEAIIDDVGSQSDLPPGVDPPPIQSEAARTGGSLIDLGLVGADNDQLNILFSVGGISTSNFVVYDSIEALSSETSATIRVRGGVLGFEPVLASELPVVTEYTVSEGSSYLTIRSEVSNQGVASATLLTGFLDAMPWTTRAIVPFSPLPELGFNHMGLDLANPLSALESPAYSVGPGNIGPADGVMDPETGARAGEVSYGLLGVELSYDEDGPGPIPVQEIPVHLLFGVSSVDATALGNPPPSLGLSPGGVISYERRLYVGGRNDVASAANPILTELGQRLGFGTGTISGDVDALDGPEVAASAIATRTGGPPLDILLDGAPTTQFRTDASGRFQEVVLPVGSYQLEFRSVERDPVVVSGVEVQADSDTRIEVPALSAVGTLKLRVEAPPRRPWIPAKITILGRNGTPDPQLGKDFEALSLESRGPDVDLRPESFGSSLAQGTWVYLPRGRGSVELRPGEYELFASRGPEYSLSRRRVVVEAGGSRTVRFFIKRMVPTHNAVAADFHIHSARSLDSSVAPSARAVAFAAEGVEVMVSTDHDFVLDYGPVIRQLGLDSWMTSLVGSEVTTTVANPPAFPEGVGHLNGWPLSVDPTARRDGAIEDEYVAPNFLYSRLRRAGADVIQYNHVRAGAAGVGSLGFFNVFGCNRCANDIDQLCSQDFDCPASPPPRTCTCVGYQPDRPITQAPNDLLLDDDVTGDSGVPNPDGLRNIDFDVMEVANGLSVDNYLAIRRDWFSLLNQAYSSTPQGTVPFLPGTGVSDSHRNTLESAGYFRTYVLGAGNHPAALSRKKFNRNIRAGRMVATTGPYIEFTLRDPRGERARIGETLVPTRSRVVLEVRVLASNWIPVEEVRVIANGRVLPELVFDQSSSPAVRSAPSKPWGSDGAAVQRFHHRVSLRLEEDSWLMVEAGAPLDPWPEPDAFADAIVPGLVPLAFTNPIFVDLDGDGFDAPGVE
jgi:hypothetical protein